jgi:sulfatase maturation enzyme AslB (radical SAM superfamily)
MVDKNTFCVAPWYSLYLDSDKTIAPCCKIKNTHNYNYNQLEEYFNSPGLNKLRNDLLNGVKNKNCESCWRDEEQGGDSMRLISNRTIALGTKVQLANQIENPRLSNIKSFDLTLGNLCNLKCVMCTPRLSSQLLAEANDNPALKAMHDQEFDQKDFDWPKSDDFVDWCKQHLPQAIHIKFTGGEPFIIPWIKQVIEHIPDSQKEKCVLHFTSNLTLINESLFEYFKKFKQVWLSVSVEGTHATHEYLRYGHAWQKLANNLKLVQGMKIKNLILKINHVVQAPSFHSITDMVDFFDSLGLEINPLLLTSPKHFHISALSEHAKEKFLADTEHYVGLNKEFINFVRNATQENIKQDKTLAADCISHLEKFDRVRKNSYKDIIPVENLS